MATAATLDQGKTSFVKEFLKKNPQGNVQSRERGVGGAGKEGTIGSTLINKMRSQMGLTGNLRGEAKAQGSRQDEASPQKAQTATETPGKTSFLKEFLHDHPQGNVAAVNAGVAGCGIHRDHQPRPGQQDQSIVGSDGQSSWEDQEDQDSRQGEGTLHRQEARAKAEGDHRCGQRAATTRQEERSDPGSDRPRSRHRPASLQDDGDW